MNPTQKLQLDLETDEIYQDMRVARDLAATQTAKNVTAQLDKVIEKYIERKRSHAKLKSMMPNSSLGKKEGKMRRTIVGSEASSIGISQRGIQGLRNS